MNANLNTRQLYKSLEVQRAELDREIEKLKMVENLQNCQRISFKVLKSNGGWSEDLEIFDIKKLKAFILKILEATQ